MFGKLIKHWVSIFKVVRIMISLKEVMMSNVAFHLADCPSLYCYRVRNCIALANVQFLKVVEIMSYLWRI